MPPAAVDDDDAHGDWVFGERKHHTRAQALSLCGSLFTDRLAAGLWYAIPLANDGILPRTNDSIGLELGADYLALTGRDVQGLWMGFGPRWDWYLTRAWQVFATIKIGLFATLSAPPTAAPAFFNGGLSLGGEYRLNPNMRLRLEGGAPFGVRIGLSIVL